MQLTSQAKKDRLIAELVETRRAILAAAGSLSPTRQDEVFLGHWSLKDLLAHLAGWDDANVEAIQALLEGRLPPFYEHRDRDWMSFNARLVAEYGRQDFADLVSVLENSHEQLIRSIEAMPPEEFDRDRGVRFRGYRVTIARLLQAEADDEKIHLSQIDEFMSATAHPQPAGGGGPQQGSQMAERILTRHPEDGKSGGNIDRHKYEVMREAILGAIQAHGEISFKDLIAEVGRRLEGRFDGSISWYLTTIKLDLEARGVIERIPRRKPQHLRMVGDSG
ncbi:MAG TPA: DinB family protein [Anaerolineae bacterium]|nr:DinB family protein [Anaerolineae bacterium]